jgi:hypothetical protein
MTRYLKIAIVAVIALYAAWMFLFSGMDYVVIKGIVNPYQLDRVLTRNNPEEYFKAKAGGSSSLKRT